MHAFLRANPLRLAALMLLVAAVTLSTLVTPAIRAADTGNQHADDALAWLVEQQIDNGGFSAFGGESDPGTTSDVVYALVAAGVDPASVTSSSGSSPLDYLTAAAPEAATTPGQAGKIVLALHAAGHDPRDVGGLDLVAAIQDGLNPETGFYGEGAVNHAYALLALSAAGAEIDPGGVEALEAAQIDDGGWSFTGEPLSDTGDSNSTALAVQALAATGGDPDAIEAGVEYILSLQDDDGAIAYDASEAPDVVGDANSTAVAIQALNAAGHDASEQTAALETFQNAGGAFFWRPDVPDDSLLATAQAVPALLGMPLPLEPLRAAQPGGEEDREAAMQPAAPAAGCDYFEVTSHNICGSFAEFWVVNGGLMMFGYPLSEEIVDENGRTVQYFERARFELHPEHAGTPYHVLLGRLGAEVTDDVTNP